MATPSLLSSQSPSQQPSPREIIATAVTQNSIPLVRQGLDLFANSRRGLDSFNLDWVLSLAVKRAQPDIVRYLLDETDATVERLSPLKVGYAVDEGDIRRVEEVLEVLVRRGWDVNGPEKSGAVTDGQYLIYAICESEELVRWCLNHRACVAYADADPDRNPPLLEIVAHRGTINTFKLLIEHGAELGRRTLHRAVESAAYSKPESRARKMEMVRFLVEEMGMDVNGMDVPEGGKRPNHWGTPVAYAAHATGGEEVVRYLLEKGANPEMKDCWGQSNAFSLAKPGNESVLRVLMEWKRQREEEGAQVEGEA